MITHPEEQKKTTKSANRHKTGNIQETWHQQRPKSEQKTTAIAKVPSSNTPRDQQEEHREDISQDGSIHEETTTLTTPYLTRASIFSAQLEMFRTPEGKE